MSESELPDMRAQLLAAARLFAAVCILGSSAITVTYVPSASVEGWGGLVWNGTMTLVYALFMALSFHELGREAPTRLLAGTAVGTCVVLSVGPFFGGTEALVLYGSCIPLLLACAVPWSPLRSLAFVPVVLVVPLGVFRHFGRPFPIDESTYVVVAVTQCVAAALANQLQRRLRARIHATHEKLLAAERMSSLGRMTAGIAHELKTPLAAARNELVQVHTLVAELGASIGNPQVSPDDLREIARDLAQATSETSRGLERATTFISAIRNHTLMASDEARSFCVAERLKEARLLLSYRLKRSAVQLRIDVPEGVVLEGSAGRFEQVLVNLLSNAIDACEPMGAEGRVEVRARASDEQIELTVHDNGPGVPADIRERIFEPLFTTRGDQQGTGLGLSIARDLIGADFGGTLELVPSAVGARFEVRLPRRTTRVAPPPDAWVPALHRPLEHAGPA